MIKQRTITLYGAGSSIIVDFEETCLRSGIEIVAIINNINIEPKSINIEKVVRLEETLLNLSKMQIIFPIFTPGHRKFAYEESLRHGAKYFASLIDPTAIIPSSLKIDDGTYINCGSVIGGCVQLKNFSFINRAVTLGHHTIVSEFASIGPGVTTGGHVMIGRGAVIGSGATIMPGITIGDNAVVGGGSVVTKNVPNNTLFFGNPAKMINNNIIGYNGVSI